MTFSNVSDSINPCSLQNKIWNLPDRSTILPKFIYGNLCQRREACRTDQNFASQGPQSGTYFEDYPSHVEFILGNVKLHLDFLPILNTQLWSRQVTI